MGGGLISVTASLLTLASFALQSSQSLYQLIESFESSTTVVRELIVALESLNDVLDALQKVAVDYDADSAGLKFLLYRCGHDCKDFEQVIDKFMAHSGESRTSFRNWAKIQYMGDDITNFKHILEGYKASISNALGSMSSWASLSLSYLKLEKGMKHIKMKP